MSESIKGRLWVRLMKRHRVERDALIECEHENAEEALRELLPSLDLSQPMWLPRHRQDWEEYSLTRFRPEHFVESVDFDYMEVSFIFPEDEKKARKRHVLEDV
ncbi:MAG: hypothetical protein IKU70_05315 [Clostridia bacterium]|nr:hypothetical protein [Clostridia bacterium]